MNQNHLQTFDTDNALVNMLVEFFIICFVVSPLVGYLSNVVRKINKRPKRDNEVYFQFIVYDNELHNSTYTSFKVFVFIFFVQVY